MTRSKTSVCATTVGRMFFLVIAGYCTRDEWQEGHVIASRRNSGFVSKDCFALVYESARTRR